MSFGFWAALFDRGYEDLWRERLHRAFPHGSPARRDVGERMRRVHALRNRVAHHDSLLDQDVGGCCAEMLRVAGWIDPEAPGWLRRIADVEAVLERRPRAAS